MKPFTTPHVFGHGRGKLLGFPTINMQIPQDFALEAGIYAAWVSISGHRFKGALHYGPVPVFDQHELSLEVFLLDVSEQEIGDIDVLTVEPVKRIREVRTFANSYELTQQIEKDVQEVKALLSSEQ